MGSAVGAIRKHRPDSQILVAMMLLMAIGLVVMFAISPRQANFLNSAGGNYAENEFFVKQLGHVLVALAAFFVAYKFPFTKMEKCAKLILGAGFGLCAMLFLFGNILHVDSIAEPINGAYRWIKIGISFQPAEVLKLGLIIYMAAYLSNRIKNRELNTKQTILRFGTILLVSLLFVIGAQKDMGTGLTIAAILLSVLLISGMKLRLIMGFLAVITILGSVFVMITPYRRDRIMTFLRGSEVVVSESAREEDYHAKQAQIAIGTGGLMGVGVADSVQSTGYLPESKNDSVFAIMGEMFGFLGAMAVVALFFWLLYRLLRTISFLHTLFGRIVVAGIFGWVASHVMINMAAMVGAIPLTGIPLPLISYGGTSLLFMSLALGLAFHWSGWTAHRAINMKGDDDENTHGRRRIGRTHSARQGTYRRNY
ncbi:MAG: FtsW/RodA/SpoVE family cell cycle protein [Candidatus Nomurabacteria bacterium]|jgi:cell division protein FtsW|nr:FtsW/RodA/SpoVE family cell cycle protein [Candidatus Nomurabacteria bacterium]